MPVFLFLLIPFHSMKMGERKNTSFLHPVNLFSTSSYFPANRLPLRYPWASFACRVMARGVGGDHLSRFAVLSPREDGSTLASGKPASYAPQYPALRKAAEDAAPPARSQCGCSPCEGSRIFVLHQLIVEAYPPYSFLFACKM